MYAQKTGNVYKPWGGTKKADWERLHIAAFHFTEAEYRAEFLRISTELLGDRWELVGNSDENPLG